jgi:hypothetical protein
MADEERFEKVKHDVRLLIIESLVLRAAVLEPVMSGRLSAAESEQVILDYLTQQGNIADKAFGRHFQEPGMTALYSELVNEVVEDLKNTVKLLAETAAAEVGRYGKS